MGERKLKDDLSFGASAMEKVAQGPGMGTHQVSRVYWTCRGQDQGKEAMGHMSLVKRGDAQAGV